MTDIQLPPLPEPDFLLKWQNHESCYTVSKPNIGSTDVYTADRMQAYARAAIEAHEARKASQWRSAAQNALIWMESAWERIDGEWGPCGKTLDQLCAEGEEPEIEALRSLLASAPPAPQASGSPVEASIAWQAGAFNPLNPKSAVTVEGRSWYRDDHPKVEQASVVKQEPVAWLVCSVNKDGSLSLEHAAAWQEAAHEHINDAINEHGIEDAASWVVRPVYTHPAPVREPLTPEHAEVLKLMVNSNRLAPIESTALCNAITALGITKDTPKPRRKASADFDLPAPNDNIGDTQ